MMYRIVAWLLIGFACFYGLGAYPLLDNNEGIYAAVARDMLKSGQFIIPHLNGLPYLEKPPLLYWLLAGSFALFGVNEWAAHLVPALALFATAWQMQRFVKRHASEMAAFAATLMFVTSLPMLAIGRLILCDMILTCFLTAALMRFYEWHTRHNKRELHYFYAFLALAMLTKGFVAVVLAGGAVGVFLAWQRSPRQTYLDIVSPRGIFLFLCIAAPWHIAASLQEPGFAWFYFINEHVLRFLNLRQPNDYYTGPPWYYLPRILAYLLPWTPFTLLLIKKPFFPEDTLSRFLWSCFLFCLAFFSLSGAKANYYMIVGMPALVMLIALRLEHCGHRAGKWLAASCLLLVIAALWLIRFFCNKQSSDLYSVCEAVSPTVIGGAAAYAVAVILLCGILPGRWMVPLVGAYILPMLPLLIAGIQAANGYVSQRSVADFLKASPYENAALYLEFEELSTLAFYMDKPLIIVESDSGDLYYGKQRPEAKPYFLTLSEWASHSPRLPLIVLNNKVELILKRLQPRHIEPDDVCVLQRFARVTVIRMCK